jgi:serine/threonine protein kinase/outer membrane protein assembly factor BamB
MLPLSADDPRVIGEFRLHTRLGAGGMGRVYLASSPGGRAVAVKVIHAHLARDAAFVDRFRREVAAAQAVNGGYAAPVVAAGPDDHPPWLATAYVAGPSLQEAVAETGPLPEDALLKLAAGLTEALRAIHNGGLVHRDLKPDNVLLAVDGPRVIDFGIARALDGTVMTEAGSVLGTPSFMSPEQAQGQSAEPASDVFSLGGVVYFAATGTGPFGSGNPAVLLYRIVHTEPDLERIPPRVRELVAACLAKDPAGRPTLAELTESLMEAAPPGNSPPAFWTTPVARLIADHQARFAAGLMAGEPPSARTPTVPAAPAAPSSSAAPSSAAPSSPATPTTSAPPATEIVPDRAGVARPGERPDETQPVPAMGRRRALAALAGAATAGLVVAGWELTRPGPAAAGNLTAQSRASSAAVAAGKRRVSSLHQGAEVWSFETNGPVTTLLVSNGVVYTGTQQRALYALDALTGKPLWHHLMSTGDTQFLAMASGALIAANGYNGVAASGFIGGVYAVDPGTGKLLWSVHVPYVIGMKVVGDVVYAGTAIKDVITGGMTALSTRTGELLWTFDFPTNIDADSGVALADGVFYSTTIQGEIWAFSAGNGRQLWRYSPQESSFESAPVVAGGILYAGTAHDKQSSRNPVLYALQARTGRELWRRSIGAGLNAFCGGVVDGLLFVGLIRELNSSSPDAGGLLAFNATTGQPLWQIPVAGGAWSVKSGPGNVVYTGNGIGVLDAWQATTGNHLWSYHATGTIQTNIVVDGGIAYFGSSDRRVYAVATQP